MVSFRSLAIMVCATVAAANTITFVSKDGVDRTIYIHNDVTKAVIRNGSFNVAAGSSETVDFPHGWLGMWYAVSAGQPDPGMGMLGEVTFNGWEDKTYFDVSSIDAPDDHEGVYMIHPVGDDSTFSGCVQFPCNTIYKMPDDVQTVVTLSKDLICTLGSA